MPRKAPEAHIGAAQQTGGEMLTLSLAHPLAQVNVTHARRWRVAGAADFVTVAIGGGRSRPAGGRGEVRVGLRQQYPEPAPAVNLQRERLRQADVDGMRRLLDNGALGQPGPVDAVVRVDAEVQVVDAQ